MTRILIVDDHEIVSAAFTRFSLPNRLSQYVARQPMALKPWKKRASCGPTLL